MREALLVGIGGFVGAVSRYKLGGLILHSTANHRFPFATFAVNIIGSLVIGIFAGLAQKHHLFTPQLRLLLITGLLGGFTTFSSFSLDSLYLLKRGEIFVTAAYIGLTILFGLIFVAVGYFSALKIMQ